MFHYLSCNTCPNCLLDIVQSLNQSIHQIIKEAEAKRAMNQTLLESFANEVHIRQSKLHLTISTESTTTKKVHKRSKSYISSSWNVSVLVLKFTSESSRRLKLPSYPAFVLAQLYHLAYYQIQPLIFVIPIPTKCYSFTIL